MKAIPCVMLVDDHHPTNLLHQRAIQKSGCVEQTIVFTNPELALDYLRQPASEESPSPDLLFLDINMPGINGWEFLEEYAKINPDRRAHTVLMMLTTSLHPNDIKRGEDHPLVTGFLHKLLTQEMVLNAVLKVQQAKASLGSENHQ